MCRATGIREISVPSSQFPSKHKVALLKSNLRSYKNKKQYFESCPEKCPRLKPVRSQKRGGHYVQRLQRKAKETILTIR